MTESPTPETDGLSDTNEKKATAPFEAGRGFLSCSFCLPESLYKRSIQGTASFRPNTIRSFTFEGIAN
jgi:hypothetical protein